MADDPNPVLERLAHTADAGEQQMLRDILRNGGLSLADLALTYLSNPFLRITDADADAIAGGLSPAALGGLIAARHAAMNSTSPRCIVFCMPKSGSSFVQSALRHALQLPFVSLTTVGSGRLASHFGMNAREQELDEMAIVREILRAPQGFVAQHHTRYTPYLALQMNAYRIAPIVTLRNIFDCLVSFDEMMLDWRAQRPPNLGWLADPHTLPHDYPQRDPAERYRLLGHSLGVWLIQFLVTWKRGLGQGIAKPLIIRYERDILDPARFVETLSRWLRLNDDQQARLQDYAVRPDRERSRLNVGQAGRGRELVPAETQDLLRSYAAAFRSELSDEEMASFLG